MNFILLLWVSFVAAAKVLRPSEDPWYQPPDDYVSAELGTVLKTRPTPHKIRSIYFTMNVANSWQVMVRSQTKTGDPIWVVNTVIEPHNADLDRVVFFQMAQDTLSADCAPSYLVLSGASMSTIYNQLEMATLQLVLDKGMYLVLPDYETHLGWWPGGRQTGYVTLDSVRGVIHQTKNVTGISPDAKVVMWGYSGGSIPTQWASALVPRYAPDLRNTIVGAALGGVVSNFSLTARHNEGGLYAGLVGLVVGGLAKQFPEFDEMLRDQISEKHYEEVKWGQNTCMMPALLKFHHKLFFLGPKKYARDGWAIMETKLIADIFHENTLANDPHHPYPQMPVILYHARHDEIINYHDSETMYHEWCEKGIQLLEFHTDGALTHVTGIVTGASLVIRWIEDRMAGVTPIEGCHLVEQKSFLDGTGYSKFGLLKMAASSVWGTALGRKQTAEATDPAQEIAFSGFNYFNLPSFLLERSRQWIKF